MSKMLWPSGGVSPRRNVRVPGGGRTTTISKKPIRVNSVRPPLSFVFVVNEISIGHTMSDTWGGPRPPESPSAYHSERSSLVMKYEDGIVTPSPDYFYWNRDPTRGNRGAIFARDIYGNVIETEAYKTATIFSCHPHMPFAMVNVDALVERTYNKQDVPDDQLQSYPVWEPLQFLHPRDPGRRGISQAVFGSSPDAANHNGPLQYVAGRNASCIPRLVPTTYRNPYSGFQLSRGLGGELTILIGLMAFYSRRGPAGAGADEFIPRYWRNNKWECEIPPQGYSCSTKDTPKGFIVSIALDPGNRFGSTRETLRAFEFDGVVVEESAPSGWSQIF